MATAYCKLLRTDYAKEYNVRHDNRLRQGAEGVEFSFSDLNGYNNSFIDIKL